MKEFKQEFAGNGGRELGGRNKGKKEGRGRQKPVREIENGKNTPGARPFLVVIK